MRIAFVGAVEGSRIALEALIRAGAAPDLVITLPAEKAERHSDFADLTTPAKAAGCDVYHTSSINSPETISALRTAEPDYCFVVGWSQICHAEFRAVARSGNIGFHPALLPQLRGRAVIPWTILLNVPETGSTLFWLDEGVDSGAILLQRRFSVDAHETAATLYDKHMQALSGMIPAAVKHLRDGTAPHLAQDDEMATYCAKRTPEDGLIDWNLPADELLRFIRAVGAPYPGAFTYLGQDKLTIDAASHFPGGRKYIGLTGQIQSYTDSGFVVRCGDGECIEVTRWRGSPVGRPKMHAKLLPSPMN